MRSRRKSGTEEVTGLVPVGSGRDTAAERLQALVCKGEGLARITRILQGIKASIRKNGRPCKWPSACLLRFCGCWGWRLETGEFESLMACRTKADLWRLYGIYGERKKKKVYAYDWRTE